MMMLVAMNFRQVPCQARFLGETFVAEPAPEVALPAALQPHVPAQIAWQRVGAFAFWTGVRLRRTCRTKENVTLRVRPCAYTTSMLRAIFARSNFFNILNVDV